jgi:hypothetical protein
MKQIRYLPIQIMKSFLYKLYLFPVIILVCWVPMTIKKILADFSVVDAEEFSDVGKLPNLYERLHPDRTEWISQFISVLLPHPYQGTNPIGNVVVMLLLSLLQINIQQIRLLRRNL